MENLSAKQLIEEHNKMVASNNLEIFYNYRSVTSKLERSSDTEVVCCVALKCRKIELRTNINN